MKRMAKKRIGARPRAKTRQKKTIEFGLFSKKEAAKKISAGLKHIHSTELGDRDRGVQETLRGLQQKSANFYYAWERPFMRQEMQIHTSAGRFENVQSVIRQLGIEGKHSLASKLTHVIEELLSNAIYHSYKGSSGKQKYNRSEKVSLTNMETISLKFGSDPEGIYVSVKDHGGTLDFKTVCKVFKRCYKSGDQQIDQKEQGAGLGLYLIFEEVTHLKIVQIPKVSTEVSCWIGRVGRFDPKVFSFNFFKLKASNR